MGDCLHVPAVDSKQKAVTRPDNSYKPFPAFGNCYRKGRRTANRFRQDAYKVDKIRAPWLRSERIVPFQLNEITTFAKSYFHFKWQLPAQFSKEPRARPRFSNDERSCSADIYDIISVEFSCEHTWTQLLCPPTLIPRKNTMRAIVRLLTSLLQHRRQAFAGLRTPARRRCVTISDAVFTDGLCGCGDGQRCNSCIG